MPDRHREKPLSLRLGPDRQPVEEAAAAEGMPVRKWILAAIRERLERQAAAVASGRG
jgi:hypothetical protein